MQLVFPSRLREGLGVGGELRLGGLLQNRKPVFQFIIVEFAKGGKLLARPLPLPQAGGG